MRVVLDTNVLLSALFWRGSPHECLLAAEAGLYDLVLAEEILEELRDNLLVKSGNTPDEADESIAGIRVCATLVRLSGRSGWVEADPDDDKFIETAIVGGSALIVSGDRHLLELGTVDEIRILSPREFLNLLASGS